MKMRTLPVIAGLGALLVLPAAHAVADVRLVASIRMLPRGAGPIPYAVTVESVGGAAREAQLILGTRSPAAWTAVLPGCRVNRDSTTMACYLGDLPASEPRTFRMAARPGRPGTKVPVVAEAAAMNASHPAIVTSPAIPRPSGEPSSVAPGESAEASRPPVRADEGPARESAGPAAAEGGVAPRARPGAWPSAGRTRRHPGAAPGKRPGAAPGKASLSGAPDGSAGRGAGASGGPDVSGGSAGGGALTSGAPASGAPASGGPASGAPASAGAAGGAPGGSSAGGTAGRHASGAGGPSRPGAAARRWRAANPHAPIIPHVPVDPRAPGAQRAANLHGGPHPAGGAAGGGGAGLPVPAPPAPPAIGGLPGNPGVPVPGAAATPALPELAPRPIPSPSAGISELTTLAPAGAMRAGRTSWATLVAVAIVAEAGLLWLAAGLTMWRRKRGDLRARTPLWPRIYKLLR